MRLLLVEDNIDLNESISNILKRDGHIVDSCFDGEEALSYIDSSDYDAIILDIMLEKLDGFEVIKYIRSQNFTIPVIFLTAKDDISDRVKGLDLGADDYLVKPFSMDELLARIRALVRRKSGNTENIFKLSNLSLDINSHTVKRNGHEIELSGKEYNILEYMIKNKNIGLTREQILENIWGFDYYGESNIVDVYINYLRKKIDENYSPKLIHTIRNFGYILKEE